MKYLLICRALVTMFHSPQQGMIFGCNDILLRHSVKSHPAIPCIPTDTHVPHNTIHI